MVAYFMWWWIVSEHNNIYFGHTSHHLFYGRCILNMCCLLCLFMIMELFKVMWSTTTLKLYLGLWVLLKSIKFDNSNCLNPLSKSVFYWILLVIFTFLPFAKIIWHYSLYTHIVWRIFNPFLLDQDLLFLSFYFFF